VAQDRHLHHVGRLGGWLDHVDPPEVEKWKDGTQFSYGSRVGCIVLSPYAKRGHISKVLHSHVSLLKFCERTFALPSLNARTAKASDMADCFDFAQTPVPPPASKPV
jgi:phospholipase C